MCPQCRLSTMASDQALGAMAAAGPHLSLQSWGPLFQSAAVLGNSVLLPLPVSSGGGSGWSERSGRCGSASEEEEFEKEAQRQDRLWAVLEAVWEFAFLQVLRCWVWGKPVRPVQHTNADKDLTRPKPARPILDCRARVSGRESPPTSNGTRLQS